MLAAEADEPYRTASLLCLVVSSHMYVVPGYHRCSLSFTYHRRQGVSYTDDPHIPSYKIVYLLLGSMAIIVGLAVIIWMPDSPAHAKFLTEEERIIAIERIRDDQGGTENKKLKKDQLIEALTDLRTWLIVLSTLLSKCSVGIGIRTYGIHTTAQRTFPTVASQIVSVDA